ncbi:MAG: hypothetical protein KJN99_14270, partial [Marinicaulis sp.]|nr:hypothetical protein [Marinicaulis sp.]
MTEFVVFDSIIFHGDHFKASTRREDNYPPNAGFMKKYPLGVESNVVNSTGISRKETPGANGAPGFK